MIIMEMIMPNKQVNIPQLNTYSKIKISSLKAKKKEYRL